MIYGVQNTGRAERCVEDSLPCLSTITALFLVDVRSLRPPPLQLVVLTLAEEPSPLKGAIFKLENAVYPHKKLDVSPIQIASGGREEGRRRGGGFSLLLLFFLWLGHELQQLQAEQSNKTKGEREEKGTRQPCRRRRSTAGLARGEITLCTLLR